MTRDQARAKIDKALVGAKDALLKYGEAAGLSHLVAEDMAGAVGRQMRRAADIYAKPTKAPEFPPGWGKPTANARKFHYFEPRPETDGGMARSLSRRRTSTSSGPDASGGRAACGTPYSRPRSASSRLRADRACRSSHIPYSSRRGSASS